MEDQPDNQQGMQRINELEEEVIDNRIEHGRVRFHEAVDAGERNRRAEEQVNDIEERNRREERQRNEQQLELRRNEWRRWLDGMVAHMRDESNRQMILEYMRVIQGAPIHKPLQTISNQLTDFNNEWQAELSADLSTHYDIVIEHTFNFKKNKRLFIDNLNVTMSMDSGLKQQLKKGMLDMSKFMADCETIIRNTKVAIIGNEVEQLGKCKIELIGLCERMNQLMLEDIMDHQFLPIADI